MRLQVLLNVSQGTNQVSRSIEIMKKYCLCQIPKLKRRCTSLCFHSQYNEKEKDSKQFYATL